MSCFILLPTRVMCVNRHRHNATLQVLLLIYNKIGDVGAVAIGEGLRCVHARSLPSNFTSTGVGVKEGSIFFLACLIFRPTRVMCVNLHRHNATLQRLDLSDNKIGDVGAAAIGEGLRCVKFFPGLACLYDACLVWHSIALNFKTYF
jgi:hypothetical protein